MVRLRGEFCRVIDSFYKLIIIGNNKLESLINMYEKKSCTNSFFLASLTLSCLFYFISENNLFSAMSDVGGSTSGGAWDIGGVDRYHRTKGFKGVSRSSNRVEPSKGYFIDHFRETDSDEALSLISNVPIEHISSGIDFRSLSVISEYQIKVDFTGGLSVDGYQILIANILVKKYPDLNTKSADSKYFFRALAENMYSMNGYLSASKFNSIVDARAAYLKIHNYIDTLYISPKIKKPLKKLYIFVCIYMNNIHESEKSLAKIKKIPSDGMLFELKNYRGQSAPHTLNSTWGKRKEPNKKYVGISHWGDYAAGMRGENLYYICAAFYDQFIDLPPKKQMEVLDRIYSFNPTVQLAPKILGKYDFFHWVLSLFKDKPKLLKYYVMGNAGWVILPKTIHFNSNEANDKKNES